MAGEDASDSWLAPLGAPEPPAAPLPVTLLLLRARLESERQRDPMDRALMDLVLAGQPFAEGAAREPTLHAVMRIAARAAQNAASEVLVELLAPSIAQMALAEAEGAITHEQALNVAEGALETARRTFARALDRGDDAELAQIVVAPLAPHLVHDQGDLYRYDGESGLWRTLDTGTLSRLIQSYSGAPVRTGGRVASELRVNGGKVRGVTQLIKDRVSRPNFFAEAPSGFASANGWVTVDATGIHLGPLLPQHCARAKMDFPFSLDARADRFAGYLDEVFAGDDEKTKKVAFLQEFLGACLMGWATKFQKAVILHGTGRNGKSTLIDIIAELFPPEACAAITPQSMVGDYFRMMLRGVRLNAVAELPRGPLLASEALKAVISGDAIMGRAIGRNPVKFRPIAGHIFAANELPEVSDHSPAFWSRFVVIEFKRKFEEEEQDKNLARDIIETELPGVALFALQGAVRLATQGARAQYTLPMNHHRLLEAWKMSGDTVARFVHEATVLTAVAADRTRFQPLYERYESWCANNRAQPVAANKFGERLKALGHRPVKPGDFVLYNLRMVAEVGDERPSA
jgi:P4 family phage/plasmid primase-like protien